MEKDMEKDRLISRYNNGQLTGAEWKELERAIEMGIIQPGELNDFDHWMEKLNDLEEPAPSESAKDKFYNWLKEEKEGHHIHINKSLLWQAAAAVLIFASGIAIGTLMNGGRQYDEQISEISGELRNMQEMMMFTLLKEGSTSDRLKAVNYTRDFTNVSDQIAEELLQTLNNDNNVNVRLATVDALARYATNPKVREGLINSINKQDSPLVQIALIEVMAALREKRAVDELQKLHSREQTTPEVKHKTEQALNILI